MAANAELQKIIKKAMANGNLKKLAQAPVKKPMTKKGQALLGQIKKAAASVDEMTPEERGTQLLHSIHRTTASHDPHAQWRVKGETEWRDFPSAKTDAGHKPEEFFKKVKFKNKPASEKKAALSAIIKTAMANGKIKKLASVKKPITKKAQVILGQVKKAAAVNRMKSFLKSSNWKPKDLAALAAWVKSAKAK